MLIFPTLKMDFTITEDVCASLNERLELLGVVGTAGLSVSDLTASTEKFLSSCNALLEQLQCYDENIAFEVDCTSLEQVLIDIICLDFC